MKVIIENNELVIRLPINQTPPLSKSGKSFLIASTNGFAPAGVEYKERPVTVSLNVIVPKDKQAGNPLAILD